MTKKKTPPKLPKIWLIFWEDSCTDMGWEHPDLEGWDNIIASVGIISEESKDHLLLSADFGASGRSDSTNRRILVPKSLVRKRIKLAG